MQQPMAGASLGHLLKDGGFDAVIKAVAGVVLHSAEVRYGQATMGLATNDERAMTWARVYLEPILSFAAGDSAEPATLTALFADRSVVSSLTARLEWEDEGTLIHFRTRAAIARFPGHICVHDSGSAMLYVIETASGRVMSIGEPSSVNLRDPARQARELLLGDMLAAGWVVLHASAVVASGRAWIFAGEKGRGKTTTALKLLDSGQGYAYLANDRVLARATPDGRVELKPYAMSVRLGGGTVRNHPALRPHLHYFDHFDASVLPLEDQFAHQDKLELTVGEFTSILGTEVAEDATLDHVFLPALDVSGNVGPTAAERIGSEETYAAVADAVLVPDPDGSGWLRALTGARDELTEPMRETLRAIAGMSATRLHGHPDDMVRQALVCAEQPVDQQPQRWLRAPLEASMVCVLHHRRSDRDLTLAPWTTRAIAEGEVHELLMVDSTADLTRPVDQVSYLGFGRFPAGLLVVGDTLIREGRPLAKLVGFDDTHLPNHMNIVFQALSEGRTGQELGIRPKEVLILGPRL